MKKILSVIAVLSVIFSAHMPVFAATATWDGGGGDDFWQTAANWDNADTVIMAADDAVFAGVTRLTPNNDFAANTNFASITFSNGAGAFTLSGNLIDLDGNVTNNDDSLQTIALDLDMQAGIRTFDTASTGNIAASGILSNGSVTKAGNASLLLSGANTYAGATAINAGVVNVSHATGLGTVAGATTVADGAALQVQGDIAIGAEALTLNGTGIAADGALRNISGTNSLASAITLGSASRINTDAGTTTLSGALDNDTFLLTVGGAGNTTMSGIISDTGGLTKDGAGTVILSGANTYDGVTTVSAGVVNVQHATGLGTTTGATSVTGGAALQVQGDIAIGAEALTLNGTGIAADGALRNISGTNSLASAITLGSASRINTDAGTTTLSGTVDNGGFLLTTGGAGNTTSSGIVSGAGGVTKDGAGTVILSGANTYTGATTVSVGVLNIQNATALGTVAGATTVADGAALQVQGGIAVGAEALTLNGAGIAADGALRNISGTNSLASAITLGSASRINTDAGTTTLSGPVDNDTFLLTVGGAGNTTISGIISDTGGLTKDGAGTLTLGGVNTYSGATTINAGTVALNADSTSGAFNLVAGTLTLGTNDYNVTTTANIAAGTTINTTTESATSLGRITSTGIATVAATANVNVTVNHALANGQTFTLVDGTGGAAVADLTTAIIDNSLAVDFTQVTSDDANLVLMANRLTSAAVAPNSNTQSVVGAINSMTTLSPDMQVALTVIDGLPSTDAIAAAYDELLPDLASGTTQAGFVASGLLASATQGHLGNTAPAGSALGAGKTAGKTGVSTGDPKSDEAVWIKGFGTYADQDRREGVNGYRAVVGGAALGYDVLKNDRWTVGVGGGYAYTDIDTKSEDNTSNVDTYQGMIYAGYADGSPWFFNGVFSFGWNEYDASRGITFGTFSRVAEANYDGQQYTGTVSGGYTFKATNSLPFDVTPLASFQYSHLDIGSYSETGAGDLSLSVADQEYDQAQLGLGVKVSKAYKDRLGTFVPEVHAKWLYDFIGDEVNTTNTFTGGGASFNTRGFDPAQHSFNAGAGLTWYTNGNMSVDFLYDFELKEDYYAHSGSATLRWVF